jgi:hypothetical protein
MKVRPKVVRPTFYFVFIAVGVLAFFVGQRLSEEHALRNPASISSSRYDFSKLDGTALEMAAKDRLLRGLKIVRAGHLGGVELGAFRMKGLDDRIADVCDVYSKVEITFMAGDMAVGGEPPLMILTGRCELSPSGDEIAAMLVSSAAILPLPPRDRDMLINANNHLHAEFKNIGDSWPRLWVLKSISLLSTSPSEVEKKLFIQNISIDLRDIRQNLGKSITLEWQ